LDALARERRLETADLTHRSENVCSLTQKAVAVSFGQLVGVAGALLVDLASLFTQGIEKYIVFISTPG